MNDPALSILIQGGVPTPISQEKLEARFEQQLANWPNPPTELGYVIADLRDDCAIGLIGLEQIDWKNRCGSQLLLLIDPAVRRDCGLAPGLYGAKALALFLHQAFSNLGLHRIEAETFAFNRKVLRSIEKAGFKQEGVRRECVYIAGRYVDSFCYGLLPSDFYGSRHTRWMLKRLGMGSVFIMKAELEQNKAEKRKEENLCIPGTD